MNSVYINTPLDKSMHPHQDFVLITRPHCTHLMYQNVTSLYKPLAHGQFCHHSEMITNETCYIAAAFGKVWLIFQDMVMLIKVVTHRYFFVSNLYGMLKTKSTSYILKKYIKSPILGGSFDFPILMHVRVMCNVVC